MPPKSTWFEPKLRDGCRRTRYERPDRRHVRGQRQAALKAAGCDVLYQPDLKGDALVESDRDEWSRCPDRARHAGDGSRCSTPGGCAVVRAAPATTRLMSPPRQSRHLRVELPGQERVAVAELAFGLDPRHRPPYSRKRRRPPRRTWNKKELLEGTRTRRGEPSELIGVGQHRPGGGQPRRRHSGCTRRDLEPPVHRASAAMPTSRRANCGVEAALRTISSRPVAAAG